MPSDAGPPPPVPDDQQAGVLWEAFLLLDRWGDEAAAEALRPYIERYRAAREWARANAVE